MSRPKRPALSWNQMKSEVHDRDMTLTELANRNGLHPSAITKLKKTTHYRAQAVLAEFIGRQPEALWPDRYPQQKHSILNIEKWPPLESQKSNAAVGIQEAA